MKDSKEKEHRISNLKSMINNIKDDEIKSIEDIEEDSELIDYLNEEQVDFEELEIDDEFIYHPGDEDSGSETCTTILAEWIWKKKIRLMKTS